MEKAIEILVSWFPMLLLIAVWIYFTRQMRGKSGKSIQDLQADLIEEQRRHNANLERLITQIDQRLVAIEKDRRV